MYSGIKKFLKASINGIALCPLVDYISRYPSRPMSTEAQRAVREVNKKITAGEYTLKSVLCEVCGLEKTKVLFTNDRYGIKWSTVCCKKCGLVFSNPRFDETTNAHFYESDLYRLIYSSGEHEGGYERRYDVYKRKESVSYIKYNRNLYYDFIEEHLAGKYESVLEIGAGGGWNLVPFLENEKICVGYEYSASLVKGGQKQGIDIRQGSEESITGVYDLIIMKHVLEHFMHPVQQLKSIAKHLKDEGYLFIEVPGIIQGVPSIQNAHNYYFSVQKLKEILQKAGFESMKLKVIKSNEFIFCIARKSDDHNAVHQMHIRNEYPMMMRIVRKFKAHTFLRKLFLC